MKKFKAVMAGLVLCILLCGISAQAGEQKYKTYDYGDTSGVLNEDYFKLDCYIYCDSGRGTGKTKGAVMGYKCRSTVTVYDKNNNALGNNENIGLVAVASVSKSGINNALSCHSLVRTLDGTHALPLHMQLQLKEYD